MYQNRREAGERLADLVAEKGIRSPVILAIPRGGVIVAAPVAQKFNTRITVLVSRKIGHPANLEVAIGAVMPDGIAIINDTVRSRINQTYLTNVINQEYEEIERRLSVYKNAAKLPELADKTVVVIDDGIATGYTVAAAIKWLRKMNPMRIVLAVPVAPPDVIAEFKNRVDEIICPIQPASFRAVGCYYQDFAQTREQEVLDVLKEVNLKIEGKAQEQSLVKQ